MKDRMAQLRRVLRQLASAMRLLLLSDRRVFTGAVIVQVLTGASIGVQLVLAKVILDDLVGPGRHLSHHTLIQVLPPLAIIVVAAAVLSFSTTGQAAAVRMLGEAATKLTYLKIFESANRVELAQFEDPAFQNRLQRAKIASLAPLQLTVDLLQVIRGGVVVIGVVAYLATVRWWLLLVILCGYVPLAVFTAQNSRNLYTFNFGQAETDRQMLYVDGLLTGRLTAGEVRGFGLGGYLSRRYADLNDDRIGTVRALASKELSRSVWAAAVSAVARGAAIVLLLAAVLFWHQISLTAAATSAIAVAVLAGRLENLGTAGGSLYQQGLLLEDLFSFIELGPWQPETAAAAGYPAGLEGASRAPQDVRVQHVTFTYPGSSQQVLRDVSIEIAPGEVVALVGENGSGKTTLAKIVAGLYLPADGAVVVDGTALDSRLAAGQRLRTAMVFQDFAKYEFTAADNIYMGAVQPGQGPDGFQEQIETAAGMAGADDFLAALPKGYQTMLSRQFGGGTDLSVGQWQRVALARAYFKDAPLIVLDEPTAALDPRSEQALFENVRKLCADRSVLMISHRLSSVREASRIYVLHHGAVVEQGTHDSLMAKQGLYHELFEIQASAYREDPDTAPYETTPTPAS